MCEFLKGETTRLSHLYQEYHVHFIFITKDGGWDGWGWLMYMRVWVGVQGVGIILQFLFYSCAFVFCYLTFSVPLFWQLEHDGSCVYFFVFLYFHCPLSTRSYQCRETDVSILKVNYLIIIPWISLKYGESFDFNHTLECVYCTLYIIRLLDRVYHLSLVNFYPCSFSCENSVSLKSTEKISQNKDEENINLGTIWNNEGVKDGLSTDILYLSDKKKKTSDN